MKKITSILIVLLLLQAVVVFTAAYKEYDVYETEERNIGKLQDIVIEKEYQNSDKRQRIDFQKLTCINPDIQAWLEIPGTNIDYPVLLGKTDTEYLTKDYEGHYSKLGSVFLYSDTKKDCSDAHICIFAHNMKRPYMFGELKKYKNKEYVQTHRELYLYTSNRMEKYRYLAAFECKKDDEIFQHKMTAESSEFEKLFLEIQMKNEKRDMEYSIEDMKKVWPKIVTLSTCSEFDRTNKRWTVHFIKDQEWVQN